MEPPPSSDRDYANLRDSDKVLKAQTALDALEVSVEAAEARLSMQDRHEGRSERATAMRQRALAGLTAWMLTMHGHARVKLADKKELLTTLGMPRR